MQAGGKRRVAVVGAGVSGLACARALVSAGLEVRLFDKGQRAPGGRVHSRSVRLDAQDQVVPHRSSPHEEKKAVAEVLSFDDGAQYFTARAPEFRAFVEECVARGCVREWAPLRVAVIDREGEVVLKPDDEGKKKEEKEAENNARYVGSPTMQAFIPFLAQPVAHTIQQSVRVADIQRREGGDGGERWGLVGEKGEDLGDFEAVVVGVPAPQAVDLLRAAPNLRAKAASESLQFDGAFVNDKASPLSWIARNSSKPDRVGHKECWVLHGSAEWSTQHLEDDPQSVARALVDGFKRDEDDDADHQPMMDRVVGGAVGEPSYVGTAFRWRFAIPANPLPERFVYDDALRIGLCGDWVGGPRVEGAFMSGHLLGKHLSASL
ncbi:FAD dependent oxidoreductase [Acanthamoeba castellanii str. Neff]|uniref:FAD dependent oxidoreductase n=1 Tax=Acanthamoeba castellanii (strain ATCC 30010 / Neff) TaxID=1257118 RepID=L8GXN3_ACACF|nr:FAD dependent oxidoreductase [Acanthamoeba castellanii str. Neff]ELR17328.1 FAD dependent oxidoreductase [Acanthamoeba castellanii str. Neff]